jgi:D-tyrosyl-tRNA(Tyr) deacylase
MIFAMIAVFQRVSRASVEVGGTETASIGKGLLVLLCAVKGDGDADVDYLVRKIAQLRIFEDGDGRMNRSVAEISGEVLVVPQFTLAASTKKGNRPSFDAAEAPERARELCDAVVTGLCASGLAVRTGVFGAMMEVSLVNDGPVTVLLDSRE